MAPKRTKKPGTRKNRHKCPLLVPHERAFGRALACHSWLSLVLQGAADLDLRGYIKDNLYPRKSSNIPRTMACKQAAMSWIFNGAGSFEKLPVQEDGPRTYHSERSEESQNECAEAKHIKIQDFSCLTTFHCNSIFALLLSFPKSLNFLLSPLEFAGEPLHFVPA